jgi:hypothetical protein
MLEMSPPKAPSERGDYAMADAIEREASDINLQWCMHVMFSASILKTGT